MWTVPCLPCTRLNESAVSRAHLDGPGWALSADSQDVIKVQQARDRDRYGLCAWQNPAMCCKPYSCGQMQRC